MNQETDDLDRLNSVFAAFEKLVGMIDFLREDTITALNEMKATLPTDSKYQFRRRTFIRTAYAMVEGTCYHMRAICEFGNEIEGIDKMTGDVLNKVLERPNPDGKNNYIRATEAIKISFKSLARVLHYDFELNAGGSGWQSLDHTRVVRDRLAHPKQIEELDLTDNEIETAHAGFKWFFSELDRLIVSPSKPLTDSNT